MDVSIVKSMKRIYILWDLSMDVPFYILLFLDFTIFTEQLPWPVEYVGGHLGHLLPSQKKV